MFLFPILAGGEETKAGGLPCIDRANQGGVGWKKNYPGDSGQRFLMADHADLFLPAFLLFLFASLMMNINFMPSQGKTHRLVGWCRDWNPTLCAFEIYDISKRNSILINQDFM